ncbi:hypothetical protein [Corynebacterium auriscanis]|nr:hypothetical protein [Corynebacterium auriscanis]MCX2163227.1 hypothetical protein [Corynebacterium auriscanis]
MDSSNSNTVAAAVTLTLNNVPQPDTSRHDWYLRLVGNNDREKYHY